MFMFLIVFSEVNVDVKHQSSGSKDELPGAKTTFMKTFRILNHWKEKGSV